MAMVSGTAEEGPARDEGSMRLSIRGSYGICITAVEGRLRGLAVGLTLAFLGTMMMLQASAQTPAVSTVKPVKMVALGDSLTAGLGLPASAAFPARLQKALGA